MKIKIEKPEESIWKFPCLGISKYGTKVYFYEWEKGVVVESSNEYKIGYISTIWNMVNFTPVDINGFELNKPKPIDWDKVELPIWFEHSSGSVNMITQKGSDSLIGFELFDKGVITWATKYDNIKERDEFLNSLKILSKGTKITIEI